MQGWQLSGIILWHSSQCRCGNYLELFSGIPLNAGVAIVLNWRWIVPNAGPISRNALQVCTRKKNRCAFDIMRQGNLSRMLEAFVTECHSSFSWSTAPVCTVSFVLHSHSQRAHCLCTRECSHNSLGHRSSWPASSRHRGQLGKIQSQHGAYTNKVIPEILSSRFSSINSLMEKSTP